MINYYEGENIIENNWETLIYQGILYDNYEINEYGQIRNKYTKHEIKQNENTGTAKNKTPHKCSTIGLGKRNKSKKILLHRAVAECFIDNLHSAGLNGSWCGAERQLCAANSRSVSKKFPRQW